MTDEQQIIEIAKLDEYECIDVSPPLRWLKPSGEPAFSYCLGDSGYFWTSDTPKYLNSLDAIVPVVRKQPIEVQRKFYALLPNKPWVDLTVPEIARTLLRATGKWQDEPKERKV